MSKRGALIVVEGPDCSGKETQSRMLADRLNREGLPTNQIDFPTYKTPTGRIVGQCYLGKHGLGEGDVAWLGEANKVDPLIASLYYAANRRAELPWINKTLDEGNNLISNRYYQSNQAHQGGKIRDKEKRKSLITAIEKLELGILELPKEDIVIFLDMPWEVGLELLKNRAERDGHEIKEHLKNAEEVYKLLARVYKNTWQRVDCAPDRTISSLRKPEDIHEEVYGIAKAVINWKFGMGEYPFNR